MSLLWCALVMLSFVSCAVIQQPRNLEQKCNNLTHNKQKIDKKLCVLAVKEVTKALDFIVDVANSDSVGIEKNSLIDVAVKSIDSTQALIVQVNIVSDSNIHEYSIKEYFNKLAILSDNYSIVKFTYTPDSIRIVEINNDNNTYVLTYKANGILEVCKQLNVETCDKKSKDVTISLSMENLNSNDTIVKINGITETDI